MPRSAKTSQSLLVSEAGIEPASENSRDKSVAQRHRWGAAL